VLQARDEILTPVQSSRRSGTDRVCPNLVHVRCLLGCRCRRPISDNQHSEHDDPS